MSFVLIKIYSCISCISACDINFSWWNIIFILLKFNLSNWRCDHMSSFYLIISGTLVLTCWLIVCDLSSNSINSNDYPFDLCWFLNDIIDLIAGSSFINIKIWSCRTVCNNSVIFDIVNLITTRWFSSIITFNLICLIKISYFCSSLWRIFINFYSWALIRGKRI